MKHALTAALAAAALTLFGCMQKQAPRRVEPMPAAVDIHALNNATVPAAFNSDDFRWMGGNLSLTVYNEDRYDAADIARLQVGDTLVYESKPLVVGSKTEQDGVVSVNGGLEEGGCWLAPGDGGTYVARLMDDHSAYTPLGKTEVALSQDFVIIDCGEEPSDPMDTIRTGQKPYIESLKDGRRDFIPFNTQVFIVDGEIKSITRRWIP